MELYDVVEAEFRPRRADDLRPGADGFIGRRLTWCASWLITVEDNEAYAGDFAMTPMGEDSPPFAWVPQRDLAEVSPA